MNKNNEKVGGAVIVQLRPQAMAAKRTEKVAIVRSIDTISYFTIA